METDTQQSNMLRCPKCNRSLAERTPLGLKIETMTLLGLIKITCGAALEDGRICDGRRRWFCKTLAEAAADLRPPDPLPVMAEHY